MKNTENQKKIFKSMIRSYTVAFFIPLLFACAGLILIMTLLNGQVSETYRSTLIRFRNVSDANLENILSIGRHLSRNDEVQHLKSMDSSAISQDLMSSLRLKSELDTQILTNNLIESIYVYFPGSKSIISSDGFFYAQENDGQAYTKVDLNAEQWQELSSFAGFSRIAIYPNSQGVNRIFITYKDDSRPAGPNMTVVTLILDPGKVQAMLDSLRLTDESRVMILDQKGLSITSSAAGEAALELNYSELDYDTLMLSQQSVYNQPRYSANYIASDKTRWVYLFIAPQNIYSRQIVYSIFILIGYVLLCGLVGVLMIPRAVKKHYSPIKRLMNTMINQLEPTGLSGIGNTSQDEYAVIENGLSEMLNRILNNEQKLSENAKVIADNAVRRIITGRVKKQEDIQAIFQFHHLNLEHPRFAVMLFSIEDFGRLAENAEEAVESGQEVYSSLDIINFVVISSINEVVQNHFNCYSLEIKDHAVCLVNLPVGQTSDEMLAAGEKASAFIRQKFNIQLTLAIGRIVQASCEIHKSYQEALQMMEYIQTTGHTGSVTTGETRSDARGQSGDWQEFSDHERHFMNLMLVENYQEAHELINSIIRNDFLSDVQNVSNVKMKIAALVNVISTAINKMPVSPEVLFTAKDNPVQALYKVRSIPELKSAVNTLFNELISYADHQKLTKPSRQEEIIAYVKEHYRNPELSVAAIADHFNISISYISRLFKTLTGLGLLDFVHSLRVEDAKRLLKTTEKSIKDIATQVGYYNSLTLTRAFRRCEGITPTDYRAIR